MTVTIVNFFSFGNQIFKAFFFYLKSINFDMIATFVTVFKQKKNDRKEMLF